MHLNPDQPDQPDQPEQPTAVNQPTLGSDCD